MGVCGVGVICLSSNHCVHKAASFSTVLGGRVDGYGDGGRVDGYGGRVDCFGDGVLMHKMRGIVMVKVKIVFFRVFQLGLSLLHNVSM